MRNPMAFSFEIYSCDDPNCGIHIVAYDKSGNVVTQMNTTLEQTEYIANTCHKHLYMRAVERDGDQ
jgi:hypothetical protein